MKYDDASWHYGGDFPDDVPNEAGATHIGMFVAWCLLNMLGSKLHTEECAEVFNNLIKREVTPGKYFLDNCDGKFTDEDLSDAGNAFAANYFDHDKDKYLVDYANVLARNTKTVYHVEDCWDNYERLSQKIRQRYEHWKSKQEL